MVIFPKSCVCQSTNKKFWIVALENKQNLALACGNDSDLVVNLKTQDYKALGFCQPPVVDQYYSIGLKRPHTGTNNSKLCNSSHSYFWRNRRNQKIDCVDGSPLELPKISNERCNLASVLPGSLDQNHNANWTRCNSVQYSICELENNASNPNFCKNASTPTTPTKTTTTTTLTTPTAPTAPAIPTMGTTPTTGTTATTALSNNSTAIVVGSALGAFAILFLLWLLHFFRKRNNAKRSASDNEIYEEVYYK